MYRLYTSEEIERYFGDRTYYKEMTRDQIKHVFGYLSKMSGKEYQQLEECLLEDGLCEISDAQVYLKLQELSPQVEMFNRDYLKKTSSKVANLYKKMCKYNKFNFKQRIGEVLDMGSEDNLYLSLLKKDMFARFATGVSLNKNKIDNDPNIVNKLMRLRDGQIDITICNSSLHSIDEQLLGKVYDQFIRVTNRYIILKDYALGENFHIMKEMAIQRELASGVVVQSDIPDLIANDPEQIADPSFYYNMEFSIESAVRYIKERGFSVVYEPPMPKSMGNVRIYVLKRDSFIPMAVEQQRQTPWGLGGGVKVEGVQVLRDMLKQQSAALNKKAFAQPTRDRQQREVTALLNKLTLSNYHTVGQSICEQISLIIKDLLSSITTASTSDQQLNYKQKLEEFYQNITDRLFNRARTCRLTPDVFADIFRDITNIETLIACVQLSNSRVYLLMQERCSQFINVFLSLNVSQTDPEMLEEMRCHAECVAKFIAHARMRNCFDIDIYNLIIRNLIEFVTPYPELIINLLEQLQKSADGKLIAQSPSQILLLMLPTITQPRARCLVINYIEQYEIKENASLKLPSLPQGALPQGALPQGALPQGASKLANAI